MNRLSKRLLSILLSLVMVITTVPAFAVTADAAATGTSDDKLLFAYFCGDDNTSYTVNQKIRLAVSEDGINFSPLNGNSPLLDNTEDGNGINFNGMWGNFAHTGGARDPFIINKHDPATGDIIDGYYVVATDLCVTSTAHSYNNQKLMVWDVTSLDTIADVKPTVIDTTGMFSEQSSMATSDDAIAWAPEVVWCNEMKAYAMVWSGPFYTNARINVAFTNDFKTFFTSTGATIDGSTTFVETLYSVSGGYTIDANINYENGEYYMVFKREDHENEGIKGQLYFAHASTLMGLKDCAPTRFYDSVNYGHPKGLEGPEVYKRPDGHWVLIADEYVKNPVCSFAMYDLGTSLKEGLVDKGGEYDHNLDRVSTNINSVYPRHGGMAVISNDEYNALNEAYAGYTPSNPGQLVAQYFTTSDVTEDATGNGYTLSTYNGLSTATIGGKENVAYFDNGSTNSNSTSAKYASVGTGQMNTGDHAFTAADGFTFMWDAYDLGTSGGYDAYANLYNLSTYTGSVGNCSYDETNWPQNGYKLSYVTSQLSAGISNGVQSSAGIQRTDGSSPALNGWHSYKAVYSRNGMVVYRDNVKVLAYAMDGINDDWVSDLFGTNGRINIGASLFANDKLFNGYISDFRIYNTSNQQNVARIDYLIENPPVVVEPGEDIDELKGYMKAFEDKMKDGNLYTNMAPAYAQYVASQEAINEACRTGDGSNLAAAKAALETAIGNMAVWHNPHTGDYAEKYLGDTKVFIDANNSSVDEYKQIYKNVLYTETGLTDKDNSHAAKVTGFQSGANTSYKTDDKVFMPECTLLYDGSSTVPQVGAMYALWGASKPWNWNWNTLRVFCCYVSNTSDIGFAGDWKGYDERLNHTWVWANNPNTISGFSGTGDSTTNYYNQGTNTERFYANVLQVKSITGDNANNILVEYTPDFTIRVGYDTANAVTTLTSSKKVRVLNYKKIVDDLKAYKQTKFANIENYKNGGMTNLINKFNEVMDKDPNDFFNATINGYSDCSEWYSAEFATIDMASGTADSNQPITHARSSCNWTTDSLPTCTVDGKETGVCVFCGKSIENALPSIGHEYKFDKSGSQYVCQHDAGHTKSVDLTVYDETQILYGLVDKSAYKDVAVIDSAKSVLDGVLDAAAGDENPQTTIDAAISSMITAINSNNTAEAEKNTYNVKFYVNIDGVSTLVSDSDVPYGKVINLDANATGLVGAGQCYSWTVSTGGTERTFSQAGNTRTMLVQADTVVTAYCSTTDRVAKIYNPYNAVLYTVAVQVGDTITAENNVITITHSGTPTTYIVGSMPYMVVTGFKLDGQELSGEYTVTADATEINIKPIVDKSTAGTYTITLDGSAVATDVAYDRLVTVDAADAYAIVAKLGDGQYAIAAYGGTYSFYANRSLDFCSVTKSGTTYTIDGKAVTDKTLIYKLNNGLPDVYSGHAVTDGADRVTTFNAFTFGYDNSSIVILEAGTVYTTGTVTEDTFVIGGEGVKQVVAKNIVNPGNQYSLSIGNGRGKGVKTRAYVRYSYTNGTGETVEAITYGNVCVLA